MRLCLIRGIVSAALIVSAAAAASAAPPTEAAPSSSAPASQPPSASAGKGDVATLLFNTPMWGKAPAGSKLAYSYEKTTSDAVLGDPLKDQVLLTLGPGDDAKSRTVDMQLFSGANRRPAGPFRSDEQNPVLLVVLENNVQEFSKLFKANPRYLKNAIRKAWRDNAKIEQATDTVAGKSVPVTRITVTPFVNDAESDKMKGLQTTAYTVDVSSEVPGYIVAVDMRASNGKSDLFAETLRYTSESKP